LSPAYITKSSSETRSRTTMSSSVHFDLRQYRPTYWLTMVFLYQQQPFIVELWRDYIPIRGQPAPSIRRTLFCRRTGPSKPMAFIILNTSTSTGNSASKSSRTALQRAPQSDASQDRTRSFASTGSTISTRGISKSPSSAKAAKKEPPQLLATSVDYSPLRRNGSIMGCS
jgi:hypothetical protein